MMTLDAATWRVAVVGRWTARILGTLMALFFLAFVVGEGPPPLFKLGWRDTLEFVGMAGLFFGLLLAWKWERCGGLVTLASFAVLTAVNWQIGPELIFLIPAAAGAMHLLCGWRIALGPSAAGAAWALPRTALWIAGAAAGVFILLCANEMFGNPPLMTPALRPSPGMVGRWYGLLDNYGPGEPVVFQISADGEVSGHIGATTVTGGRIGNDRSWFGSLMHWREPYEIRGKGFTAGASIRGGEMRAFICFSGSPTGWGATLRKQ